MTTPKRKLLIRGAILALLVALIFIFSRYGPQPFGVLGPLWEEWDDLEEFYSKREKMRRFLVSFGPYSSAVFVMLQAIQVVAAPIPGELTGVVGGYAYGKSFGFLLSTLGLTLGSWVAFELASILGRPFVEKFVKQEILEKFNFLTTNTGATICFLLFILPGFPKDYLCYLLGLSWMKLGAFLIVSTVGRLPGTYLLSLQGASIRNHEYSTAVVYAVISAVILFFAYLYRGRLFHWVKKRGGSIPINNSLQLLMILAAAVWFSSASGQQPVARFFYNENGSISRQERDTNGDGKIDRWLFYDTEGKVERVEQDENFDGKPDLFLFYEEGKLKRQEVSTKRDGRIDRIVSLQDEKLSRVEEDTNGDGKMDCFSYFEGGQLAKKEVDRKHTGRIDLWGYYQNGELVRQEEDLNGDGRIDETLYFQGGELVRREDDTRGKGRIDLIEFFSQGKLTTRLTDSKGDGQVDTLYVFKDNKLMRQERDTDSDGFFDLRVFYENNEVVRREADTNRDRRVDVWAIYKDGKLGQQDEDQNFNGKIDARYYFKEGQVTGQEQVAEVEPDPPGLPFSSVQEKLPSVAAQPGAEGKKIAGKSGLELGTGKR